MFLKDEPDLRVCSTKYDSVRFIELKAHGALEWGFLEKSPIPPNLTTEQHGRLLLLTPDGCHNFGGLLATEYSMMNEKRFVVHIMVPGMPAMGKGLSRFCALSCSQRFAKMFPTICAKSGEAWFSYDDDNAGQILLENAWVFQLPWWRGLILPEYHHFKGEPE